MSWKKNSRFYEITKDNGFPVTLGSLPSVTTILGAIAKPALYKWYEDKGVKKAFDILAMLKTMSPYIHDAIIGHLPPEFLKSGNDTAAEAADVGTEAHNAIQKILHGQEIHLENLSDKARNAVFSFEKWRDGKKMEIIKTESVVYHEEYLYAGTMDALIELDGRITLADWKTSKGIYGEYHLQAVAYKMAVEKMTGNKVPDVRIFRFGKDGSFEHYEIPQDQHGWLFGIFLGVMDTWKWMDANDRKWRDERKRAA